MYPGYSPADHEYGKAAEEYGKAVAEAQRRGVEIPQHPDVEYKVGQAKGTKPYRTLAEIKVTGTETHGQRPVNGSSEENGAVGSSTEIQTDQKIEENPPTNGNQYFVIDTQPTPVNFDISTAPDKRSSKRNSPEAGEGSKPKKQKKKHSGDLPLSPGETHDISEEVEARLKTKEDKKKRREEKKRKRESEKSEVASGELQAEVAQSDEISGKAKEVRAEDEQKPEKKKKKTKHGEEKQTVVDRTVEKKRKAEHGDLDGQEGGNAEKKKRKKGRKEKSNSA